MSRADAAEMERIWLAPVLRGLGAADQRIPFQCRNSGRCTVALAAVPAAQASPRETAATEVRRLRPLAALAVGLGLGTRDHRVQFQCSISVRIAFSLPVT